MTGEQTDFHCKLIRGPARRTLKDKFDEFHKEHPEVMEAIHRVADEQRKAGRRRISLKWIFEILRADPTLQTADKPYKLNNNYTAFYARELIRRDARFRELVELREVG